MSSGALQLLRACTASLSSRSLARSSALVRSQPRRHYSDAKPAQDEVTADTKDAPASEKSSAESENLSPEAVKLKAKEAEVTDLMGRLRYLQADFLNLQRNAAGKRSKCATLPSPVSHPTC
ncbi:hypothetical protein BDZ89DRAFT_1125409 [Hymenopellis radicata]|nr:hypothetical protein BDZ89DRAFT_1125409 [Hymenopellis radicata]